MADEHNYRSARSVADVTRENVRAMRKLEELAKTQRSTADRVAELVARFGGSIRFVWVHAVLFAAWIAWNVVPGLPHFDPYPFILLNLVLSCIAALQAPVIMMSQKRQEAKDRLRSLNDYQVNLKAELEIRHLHEKLDHLINKQWQRLAEIQQLQLEIMQDRKR